MKSICLFAFSCVLIPISMAVISQNPSFGPLETLEDCVDFNNNTNYMVASASVAASGRGRGTWKILGHGKKFPVEDCFKKVSNTKKTIIVHVTGEFQRLRAFPRGPAIIQLHVAEGPNSEVSIAPIPHNLDTASFRGVLYGFSESETGAEDKYTKDQLKKMLKVTDSLKIRSAKFLHLNAKFVQNSEPRTFEGIKHDDFSAIILYHHLAEKERLDINTIVARLGYKTDIQFLFNAGVQHTFERMQGEDAAVEPGELSVTIDPILAPEPENTPKSATPGKPKVTEEKPICITKPPPAKEEGEQEEDQEEEPILPEISMSRHTAVGGSAMGIFGDWTVLGVFSVLGLFV